jgi:O-antigen/teichoic acid export membrane protein
MRVRPLLVGRLRALMAYDGAAVSLLDQAVISGGNFLSGFLAAISLEASDFGLYVLATVIILEAAGIQSALTLQPMIVNGASLSDRAFCRFFGAQVIIQAVVVSISSLVVLAITLAWEPLRPFALPLMVASAAWQAQEFLRRVLYTRGEMVSAVFNNFVSYDIQAGVLALLAWSGQMTIAGTLWVVAATSTLGVLVGLFQVRHYFSGERDAVRESAQESFQLGRWIAGSYVLSASSTGAYPVLLAGFSGLSSTAGYGIVKQMIGPLHLLTRPLENFYLPRAARALDQKGTGALAVVLWQATCFTVPFFIVYVAIVVIGDEWIIDFLYGERYVEHVDAVRLWALTELLWLPWIILRLELAARRFQRHLLLVEVWTAAVVYGLGVLMIGWMGLMGAAITNVVVAIGASCITAAAVMYERRRARLSDAATPTP